MGPNLFVLLVQNVGTPYSCPSGQADRKGSLWGCGIGRSEEAKARR